ncbi:hypothetical protein K2173_004050 [Erythroxylum novogranatense]|uniref:Aromatic amino acid beta-eliminating lyase/threonine aldolase domain-containing protein n=1 Tax=Erythroxylum novogranatense TaxID=1862640 RepID=A0AAV8SK90_9ROSI|nr:hypothetical protein K2173_004050 [Erythroxylum novogranatense]
MVTRLVDLRSDTVTKPNEAMRAAIANAKVDGAVLGDDPTAFPLFAPLGTMGNLISVPTHYNSHIHIYENGGISTIGGVHARTVKNNKDGVPAGTLVYPTTRLICLENSQAKLNHHGYSLHLPATRGSTAAKLGVPKVSKPVALAFMKRTLGRYRRFEDTGKCCFSETVLRRCNLCNTSLWKGQTYHDWHQFGNREESAFQNSLFSAGYWSISDKLCMGTSDAFDTLPHSCDQDLSKTGRVFNKGKKKEVLLDDVGGNGSFRAASSLNNMLAGGAKGKRSERERDRDALAKNSVSKTGRASQTSIKGDRKTKPKPKQKTAQLSTPGDGNVNKFKETDSNKKQETGRTSNDGHPRNLSIKNRDRTDITAFGCLELDVTEDLGDHQDLSMLLNFDVENELGGLEIPTEGLEIPMDDLSDLNMFL